MREIAHHLADSELNSAVRLRRLIAEDDAAIQGYDERTFMRRLHATERPIASSIEAAAAARASTLSILECPDRRRMDADRDAQRAAARTRVEAGSEIYADHPSDHADQARRVLAALREAPVDTLDRTFRRIGGASHDTSTCPAAPLGRTFRGAAHADCRAPL